MLAIVNGFVTVLAMITFIGIVWWAWSAHRVEANRQAAQLPFSLPEEYQKNQLIGDSHE